ncbi:EamA family transporter [Marinomonas pontica]|uniref:EamA family transporter n=1 Tax=Marinomonas pontica TaxID=264739 RepID=UPI002ADE4AB8|nr:EamA family transporter [Marinomonas pontica]
MSLNFGQFAFLFSAMSFGMPAGLASLVLQSQAIFTLLFAVLLLKEAVRPYQVLAIGIAIGGLAVIGFDNEDTTMTALGFGLTLAAGSSWALGNIFTKIISRKGYDANLNLIVWSSWVPPVPFFLCAYFIDGGDVMWSNIVNLNLKTRDLSVSFLVRDVSGLRLMELFIVSLSRCYGGATHFGRAGGRFNIR